MITVSYHRYVFEKEKKIIQVIKNSKIIGIAVYKDQTEQEVFETKLLEAYKHAKEWLNQHMGYVEGEIHFDGIDYNFKLSNVADLFQRLIIEGYVLTIE